MIAACPKCAARYRVERERLAAGVVRLRCARCEAVFRVRLPAAPQAAAAPPAQPNEMPAAVATPPALALPAARPAQQPTAPPVQRSVPSPVPAPEPSGECVLVAMRDGEVAKRTAELLAERGLQVVRVSDGVEAMLEIQRRLPRAVVLAADLPKMFGFQICEILKRNASLRGTWAVLVGAIHHPDRYRREAGDLYGADAYLEAPDLPEGLLPLLERGGVTLGGSRHEEAAAPALDRPAPEPRAESRAPSAPPTALRAAEAKAVAASAVAAPMPAAVAAPVSAAFAAQAAPAPAAAQTRPRGDGLDEERAKAERLARIVISDIVLYNEERFAAAARAGKPREAMAADLAEGRALFDERIDPRVRAERNYLEEELLRCARLRGMR